MEETIILEKVKAGDAAAFSLLYDLYWLKVYNFARLYVTSSSVISEVVQDVFVKVWESKEFLDITKNFDGLLFMITRNIIFNYSRRHFNELNFKMTVLKGLENSYDIEEELDAADLKNYIDKLISQLCIRQGCIGWEPHCRCSTLPHKDCCDSCAAYSPYRVLPIP